MRYKFEVLKFPDRGADDPAGRYEVLKLPDRGA